MSRTAPVARVGTVSRALARDRLGVPSVLAFVLASIAAMTVCAGVIPERVRGHRPDWHPVCATPSTCPASSRNPTSNR